jgi:hypothetical protein
MNSSMMQFDGIAAIFAVIAVLCLLAGYKLLASSSWIVGWLCGNLGMICVLLTGFLGLCVIDIRSYKPMFDDKTIATLSFRETSRQHYEVRIVDALGIENRYSIAGDAWYISGNQFRWSKRLSLGMGHGYRFQTIIGSYTKTNGTDTRDTLQGSRYFDVWKFMNSNAPSNFLVSTATIVTEPQPLADAAMYEVVPSGFDLVVKPLNEFAKRAQLNTAQLPPASAIDVNTKTEPVANPVVSSPVEITAPAVKTATSQ